MAKKKTYSKISIIFPNWNGKKETLFFLSSLASVNYPSEKLDVIMVDNDSQDDSVKTVKDKFPRVSIVALRENVGFAAGVNAGIEKAKGEMIFVCNNDTILHPDTLTKLSEFLEENPEVGVVGPKIVFVDTKGRVSSSGYKFNPWTGGISSLPNPEVTKETDWVQGCAMLFRKDLIDRIGPFDEGFFFSFEDQDFCLRARRAGFKTMYYPKATLWHGESTSIDKTGTLHKNFQLYKAKFRFIFKNSSPFQILTSLLLQFTVIAFYKNIVEKDKVFFPIFRGFFSYPVMLKALLWNLQHLSQTRKARKKGFLTFPKPIA